MNASFPWIQLAAMSVLLLPSCEQLHFGAKEPEHYANQTIVVTSPKVKDIVLTQPYVCQIHSRRHIEVSALQDGYLQEILVKEGQTVKKGDVMFRILPTLYQARLDAEKAEAELAQIEFNNTKKLYESKPPVVSIQEVALAQAKLNKANAKAALSGAELDFTVIRAPFDGIVDRLLKQLGSLIGKNDVLTTLSDNQVMWVYFNVPEVIYLDYMAHHHQDKDQQQILLVLANGKTFPHPGTIGAIEADFNHETGNIAFRADFPNPDRLLRNGQTGNVLIKQTLKDAIVIPQRATFEILDKQYVFVIGEDHVVHQRLITIEHELDDIFIIESGLKPNEQIVLEGVRQVHEGDKVEHYEFQSPDEVLKHLKYHAE